MMRIIVQNPVFFSLLMGFTLIGPSQGFDSSSPNFKNQTLNGPVSTETTEEARTPVPNPGPKSVSKLQLHGIVAPGTPGHMLSPAIVVGQTAQQLGAPLSRGSSPQRTFFIILIGAASTLGYGYLWVKSRRNAGNPETMALVAHELKSPLTAIESYLELMEHESSQPSSSKELRHWLEDIRQMKDTAAHLRQTIADLLEMTQIESGKMKLVLRSVDVGVLAREVTDAFRAKSDRSALKVALQIQPDLPRVTADPDRVRQVFNNLLSNAIKFTPSGGRVDISIRSDPGSGKDFRVHCTVRDTGVGMNPKEQKKLFGKFVRLKPSVSGEEGTGLGLYITKAIIEAHHGQIWSESEVGKGSSFHFYLSNSHNDT